MTARDADATTTTQPPVATSDIACTFTITEARRSAGSLELRITDNRPQGAARSGAAVELSRHTSNSVELHGWISIE